jgi:homeobox-leucine zipper protein
MAGAKICGSSSNTTVLPQNNKVLESFWIPTPSSNIHGSKSMVSFENVHGDCTTVSETPFFQAIDHKEENCGGDDDFDECFNPAGKKRRLSATQVQFLEKSFEVENKLEPERKVQLAKDLGLQPRQVAIWFQNRRARYKNKQLEKDYDCLKSSYDKVKSDYEILLNEKEELKNKIVSLKQKLLIKEGTTAESITKGEPQNDATKNVVDLPMGKQEDASSAKSDVFDSDSPQHCTDQEPADSCNNNNVFESDFSQDEDDNKLIPLPSFLKVEDDDDTTRAAVNSCNFGFSDSVEDQPFWAWNY